MNEYVAAAAPNVEVYEIVSPTAAVLVLLTANRAPTMRACWSGRLYTFTVSKQRLLISMYTEGVGSLVLPALSLQFVSIVE